MGLISPLGNSKESLWEAICAGRSGVEPIRSLPADHLPVSFGGEARYFTGKVEEFGPLEREQLRAIRKNLKVMCREIQMGVAAAQLALTDAGLKLGAYDSDRTGVVFGADHILTDPQEFTEGVRSCLKEGGEFDFSLWAERGLPKVTPLWLLKYLPNMPASHIAIYNDLRGPNNSITLREASANLAIGEAYCTIIRGHADTMLAGATGTRLHPLRTVHVALQEELAANGTEPAKACRPFDRHRSGMVIGEGAAVIVLENLETAQRRGATILAEVVGFGSSAALDRQGKPLLSDAVKNVLRQTLHKAAWTPSDVGHVHAHGLSTRHGDREEALAIQAVFAGRPQPVPVTAAKSYMGNLGAGSGISEVIASVMALRDGRLFPILNYETPDPECPIGAVGDWSVPAGAGFVHINMTPQGQASCVALRRV
jgi:3-oxoacyl-[acyl-carrier-protein] synthase II